MEFNSFNFTLNPKKRGVNKILGDLESRILEILWDLGQASVRDVFRELYEDRDIAYTTVMTVMGRLAKKGLLDKKAVGNAYIYSPAVSREDFARSVIKSVLSGLVDEFYEPVLSQFVQSLEAKDKDKLSKLAELIDEEKKRRKK
jgi:predicted transcriptional regulator